MPILTCHGKVHLEHAVAVEGCDYDIICFIVEKEGMVSISVGDASRPSCGVATHGGSTQTTSFTLVPSESPVVTVECLEAIEQFAMHVGAAAGLAKQFTLCWRKSSRVVYQYKCFIIRDWCKSKGHTASFPSVSKVADFLLSF